MTRNPPVSVKIDVEVLRNRIAGIEDPTTAILVAALCDFVEVNQPGLELLDHIFGPLGLSPAQWGVTDWSMDHHAMEPARMRVELVRKRIGWP
jgi:hypothetical protein